VIEYLTLDYLLELIEDLGVGPIRDVGLFDSAVHRPQATVYGDDAYPDVDQKAAVLLESLVRNHP
jgi:death-on-curing protein